MYFLHRKMIINGKNKLIQNKSNKIRYEQTIVKLPCTVHKVCP